MMTATIIAISALTIWVIGTYITADNLPPSMRVKIIVVGLVISWMIMCLAHGQGVEVFNTYGKCDDKYWKDHAFCLFLSNQNQRWLSIQTNPHTSVGFPKDMTVCYSKFKPIVELTPSGWKITFTQ